MYIILHLITLIKSRRTYILTALVTIRGVRAVFLSHVCAIKSKTSVRCSAVQWLVNQHHSQRTALFNIHSNIDTCSNFFIMQHAIYCPPCNYQTLVERSHPGNLSPTSAGKLPCIVIIIKM